MARLKSTYIVGDLTVEGTVSAGLIATAGEGFVTVSATIENNRNVVPKFLVERGFSIGNSSIIDMIVAGETSHVRLGTNNGAAESVALEFWRGTNASWQMINTGGVLKLQSNYTAAVGLYADMMTLAYNTGNMTVKGTVEAPTFIGALTGNAATATKLTTARTINGVSFDGTANITVADSTKAPTSHASAATTYGVSSEANYGHAKASNVAGSANGVASKGSTPTVFAQSNHVHPLQTSVSGNAGTSDKWKTARNISISDADGTNTGTAVVVDGSENETLKLPATIKANLTGNVTGYLNGDITGNAYTADTADKIPFATKTGTSTGTQGQASFDASYLYLCTATNVWKRVELTSF